MSGPLETNRPLQASALRAIIFDFNGVLWWDEALQDRAWSRFAVGLRGRPLTPQEMAVHVHGRTNRHTLEYLLARPLEADQVARLGEEKEVIYRRLCLDEGDAFRLSPGAVELLDALAVRGLPRTIATASGRANVDFFIQHLDLGRWFDPARIVFDDGTLPGKPAPDVYLRAAAVLGCLPAECLVVEDSRAGIAAAHAAGIGCLVALGPRQRHADLRQLPGVNHVVESLGELLA